MCWSMWQHPARWANWAGSQWLGSILNDVRGLGKRGWYLRGPSEELDEDPDRPFELAYKKYPTKLERTGIHSIQTLRSTNKTCLRKVFAEYLNDSSSSGYVLIEFYFWHLWLMWSFTLALDFVTPWCCNRPDCPHSEGFKWPRFFLGEVYNGKESTIQKSKTGRPKNRAMKDRPLVRSLLATWRSTAHKADPLRSVRPATFIIDDNTMIKLLATILPGRIRIPSHITEFLSETKEWSALWALPIFDVIHKFDNPPVSRSPSPTSSVISEASSMQQPAHKKRKMVAITSASQTTSLRIRIPAWPLARLVLKDKLNTTHV